VTPTSRYEADVTAAYKTWDAAFDSGDAKAIAASYAADAELLPPTHTIAKGPAEIEKFFDDLIKGGVKSHALKLVEAGGHREPRNHAESQSKPGQSVQPKGKHISS